MIVLDEQLLGRGIEGEIAAWYPGAVCFITDLRPGTVIKDDAIPSLLQQEAEATFVTINVVDFWQKVSASQSYCIVCIAVSDSQTTQISPLLRRLFRHPNFSTKAKRMAHVIRLSSALAQYYSSHNSTIIAVTSW